MCWIHSKRKSFEVRFYWKLLTLDNLRKKHSVVCVRKVRRLLIISSFIVKLQGNYRVCFSVVWGCMGYARRVRFVGELMRTIGTT
jgi:hypothetical protein